MYTNSTGVHVQELILLWGGNYGLCPDMFAFNYFDRIWKQLVIPDMPAPRAASASTSFNHEIYIFGGIMTVDGVDEVSNELLVFDARTKSFTRPVISSEDVPPPRMCATMIHGISYFNIR